MMHPSCPYPAADCRITINSRSTEIIAGVPVFNGFGQIVADKPDPNTVSTHYACRVCKASWAVKQCAGKPDEFVTHTAPQGDAP